VSECHREASIVGRPWPNRGCCFVVGGGQVMYILLRPTKSFIRWQLLNDQDCKFVGSHTVETVYDESICFIF
jgi:hypothetical protein